MKLIAFYAENPERNLSGEVDYGVWWLDGTKTFPRYRVSYIQATGEIYVINQSTQEVQVLGVVLADEGEWYYYETLDKILDGWAEKCGQPNGLQWVKEQLHRCEDCGTRENLLDSRNICWPCNDEARKEEAIENRAEEKGQRY